MYTLQLIGLFILSIGVAIILYGVFLYLKEYIKSYKERKELKRKLRDTIEKVSKNKTGEEKKSLDEIKKNINKL